MKTCIFLFLLLSASAFADDYRHMVSFGTQGLGWSGAAERMETRSESAFADVDSFMNNISLNYSYRVNERIQAGFFFSTSHTEYKFNTATSTARTEVETNVLGIFGLYNFSDTISSAWYAGLSVASYTQEQETSHDVALAESKVPFELDDAGMMYEIVAGKRFRLLKWNIDHLTYSPQIGVFHRTHSKDFDDQNVKNGFGVSFQPIKFDLLF